MCGRVWKNPEGDRAYDNWILLYGVVFKIKELGIPIIKKSKSQAERENKCVSDYVLAHIAPPRKCDFKGANL